jgi:transcriptional regulator with XRE-family HTH domain
MDQKQNLPASSLIAEKLRQVRENLGLTQEQVAILLKRPQSYVSRCEMGIKRLEIRDLESFSRVYGQKISFFLAEETR